MMLIIYTGIMVVCFLFLLYTLLFAYVFCTKHSGCTPRGPGVLREKPRFFLLLSHVLFNVV